jgi:hypothetical protein
MYALQKRLSLPWRENETTTRRTAAPSPTLAVPDSFLFIVVVIITRIVPIVLA